ARPLLAVPLWVPHDAADPGRAGEIIKVFAEEIPEAARRHECDVVAVAGEDPVLAAAQATRLDAGYDPWPELDKDLKDHAAALAQRALRGQLALFVGAGISAGAGLPLMPDLLQILAERAGLNQQEREGLKRLTPPDQAAVLERRL